MSFLDRIKAVKNTENPFGKQIANPFLKMGEQKSAASALTKKNDVVPFIKKPSSTINVEQPVSNQDESQDAVETVKEEHETVQEATNIEVVIEHSQEQQGRQAVEGNTDSTQKPEVQIVAPQEEIKADSQDEELKAANNAEEVVVRSETTNEAQSGTKGKRRRNSNATKKQKANADTNKENGVEPEQADTTVKDVNDSGASSTDSCVVDLERHDVAYNVAIAAIMPAHDKSWLEFKEEIIEEVNSIKITDDMTPAVLKILIAQLSQVREKIWQPYCQAKTAYDVLVGNGTDGMIERIKRVNLGNGSNEMERRRAGIIAAMNLKTPEGIVNLYDLVDETYARYNFLKSIMDLIQYKTNVLITMNGALKLEQDHVYRGDN